MSDNQDALLEYQTSPDTKVDKENFIVSDVKLLGTTSRNNREYTAKARASTRVLLENMPVGMNHIKSGESRSVLNRNGVVKGIYEKEDGVYAKVWELSKEDPNSPKILEMAERWPSSFGMSIAVPPRQYKAGTKNGKLIVEDIFKLDSIDLVATPGTVNSLFESYQEPQQKALIMTRDDISPELVEEIRAEVLESLKTDEQTSALKEELAASQATATELREKLDEIEAANAIEARKVAILEEAKELKAGELTEEAVKTYSTLSEEAVTQLLQDRASIIALAPAAEPQKHAEKAGTAPAGRLLNKFINKGAK